MKLMGIDYGSRNVGIALSDDEGVMAFPYDTFLNTKVLAEDIMTVARNNQVTRIVLGESKNKDGEENPIMKKVHPFKAQLEEMGMKVEFQDERFTSQEASRLPHRMNEQEKVLPKNDAAAATLILQAFIDKNNEQN